MEVLMSTTHLWQHIGFLSLIAVLATAFVVLYVYYRRLRYLLVALYDKMEIVLAINNVYNEAVHQMVKELTQKGTISDEVILKFQTGLLKIKSDLQMQSEESAFDINKQE
jgi:hypothetical protein